MKRIQENEFEIGDRVIYISGNVPEYYGKIGTVTGWYDKTSSMVGVLFDKMTWNFGAKPENLKKIEKK